MKPYHRQPIQSTEYIDRRSADEILRDLQIVKLAYRTPEPKPRPPLKCRMAEQVARLGHNDPDPAREGAVMLTLAAVGVAAMATLAAIVWFIVKALETLP